MKARAIAYDDEPVLETRDDPFSGEKVGGVPAWIQSPEGVNCKDCGKPMKFIARFSGLNGTAFPESGERGVTFGDGGTAYVFLCASEKHPGALIGQST